MRPLSATEKSRISAAAEDRRLRIVAIALMCGAMLLFTGLDTSSKWLGLRLPISEIVWARYMGATVFALIAARPWSRPAVLISKRPWLQALRSLFLLGSTAFGVIALRSLQLAETATISFLLPILVALAAGPLLGERVGRERMIAIVFGFLGVLIATRPGTSAFQPVVVIAVAGVLCNAGYFLATRKLAGVDSSHTTLVWTQAAGVVLTTPLLPWTWATPQSLHVWAVLGGPGRVRRRRARAGDRRPQIRAGAGADALLLHPAHLDDRVRLPDLRRRPPGRDPDRRSHRGRLRRVSGAARAGGARRGGGVAVPIRRGAGASW